MQRRSFIQGCAAALIATCVAGPAFSQGLVKLRVGGTPNYGPIVPVHAAEKLGLFEKLGLDVEFTGYQGGAAAMEALAAREVDIVCFFPPGLALAKSRGVEAVIVGAGTLTPRGWMLMTARGSDITEIGDLAGKSVGITSSGSTTDFFALWAADQAGGEVTRVPVGGGGLITNLLAGNVDAIVAYPPVSYQMLESGDGAVLVDLGEAMEPNLPDVWIASQSIVDAQPDVVKAYLVGVYSAAVYMQANPEWAIEFLMEVNGFERAIAEREYENTIKGLSPDGAIKAEWVEASLQLAKLAGLEGLPEAETLFVDTFVPVETVAP